VATPILELQHVSKSFGKLQVINDLSFAVARGEALGILGPNGAGKSTTFSLIGGDHAVSAGRVLFKGNDLSKLPAAQRCHLGIGRTYQIPRPFGGLTVYENLLVGAEYGRAAPTTSARDLCGETLRLTGLWDKRDWVAGRLSLLERKRLELARALATEPELLLLDEIAGGLTEHEVHELLAVIAAIRARGVTIIWIEHIIHALASAVDRILVINFGAKLIEGPPQSVLESRELHEIYLGVELA
jgi:branched-chain amino acid transport system ATP-binding protein